MKQMKPVKKILKSVKICQNYSHEIVVSLFLAHPVGHEPISPQLVMTYKT